MNRTQFLSELEIFVLKKINKKNVKYIVAWDLSICLRKQSEHADQDGHQDARGHFKLITICANKRYKRLNIYIVRCCVLGCFAEREREVDLF